MAAARRSSPKRRSPLPPSAGQPTGKAARVWLWAGALAVMGALVYANSLTAPFAFDDKVSILENADIRRVWSLASLRSEAGESPVVDRPLVTLSFAVNYALGGLNVTGYHVGNIAIHILCALLMFGLVRRIHHSIAFAFCCASLWMLHPLNTEAVDYISQRTELMMAFFYLATVYASVRAHTALHPSRWLAAAFLACALGMACKQSMVTAPVAVVLVDRVFFFTSLREAIRRRWRAYGALALTTLLLPVIQWASPQFHSMGLSSGVSPWRYLLNQSVMITRYLELTVWPRSLVIDYGYPRVLGLGDVLPQMLFIAALLLLTAAALWKRPAVGFLGAWFFVTLAPASSVVPIATEVGAERRMYLPLAALVVLAASGVVWLTNRIRSATGVPGARMATVSQGVIWAGVAAGLATGTIVRNREYASPLDLARLTAERWPTGHIRHVVGNELFQLGRREEAIQWLREAIRDDTRAHYTLGVALFLGGSLTEARQQLRQFIELEPQLVEAVNARVLIGRTLLAEGQFEPAAEQLALAGAMQPSNSDVHLGLAEVRFAQRRFADSIGEYRAYLATHDTNDAAWTNLGLALLQTGQSGSAIEAFRRAVSLAPESWLAHRNLAASLLDEGSVDDAAEHAGRAVALRPDDPMSHDLLGVALLGQRKTHEAIGQFQESLRLAPADTEARAHLQHALGLKAAGGGR